MSYAQRVIDLVTKRDPGQPEFHQAVTEVLGSLQPCLDRNPKYEQNKILEHVGFGSTVYTDGWPGYDRTDAMRYVHETVNHATEYVRGEVSTQAIENFWSCLKRTLKGTYVAVEPFHLDRYLDEQMFRFNNRIGHDDGTRFQKALGQVAGKRLTWVELTGKESLPAL